MKLLAAFLDRDGVINYDPGNFHKINNLKILPRVAKAIRFLNTNNICVIVITNQPVVARGWITERGVNKINSKIEKILKRDGAKITKFYWCPHHPNANLSQYRIDCDCRKPKTGLFKKAACEFNLNIKKSFVIGDSFRDIESAANLGCKSIAVGSGSSDFRDSKPDFTAKDLYEAAKLIISQIS
jgi:D-glycero-D-manno-heptose 1,7-bisphosphate phosphatase